MAWDVEGTKLRLLEAGTHEFAEYGLAGARVDRIAATAGVNKERIYQYFGKKDQLFDAVLSASLGRVRGTVPFVGHGPEAIADYAGRLFDNHANDPVASRLVFWEGLERPGASTRPDRIEHHEGKVAQLNELMPELSRSEAAELLLTIVTLCTAWPVLQQIDELLVGIDPSRKSQRRAFVVRTILAVSESFSSVIPAR